ncbi:MAG: substrate-binding periplasmic protein [Desulfovibrio sp.]
MNKAASPRRFLALLALAVLLAPFLNTARSAQADPLRFLAEAGYAPYSFAYGDQARGIDCELFQELARRLDLEVVIELFPRSRMLSMIKNGEADGVVAMNYLPELADRFVFARRQAIRSNSYDLFSRSGQRVEYQGPESLAKLRIALPEGVHPSPKFDEAEKQGVFQSVRVPGESDCVRLLLMDQTDAFVGQTEATYNLLTKMGMTSTILAARNSVGRDSSYVAVSSGLLGQKPENLVRLMELVLGDMLADGTYRKIVARYLLK